MTEGSAAVWFGASGFEVLNVFEDGLELVVEVQTLASRTACRSCGTRAKPKDRRWVTVRDAPVGSRPVRVRWHKPVWCCPDSDCEAKTWTEQAELALPRHVLTSRAEEWVTDGVAALEGTTSSIAKGLGVAWATVWSAVTRVGRQRADDPDRVGPVEMAGFDETVMQPARRLRRRRFVTAAVDVSSGQILDVFEGRDAQQLREWMQSMPKAWLSMITVVSLDPHEGYRSAIVNPDPLTGRPSPLAEVTVVVDPFHVVRLANQAVTRCRQRVQQAQLAHRGWKGDPLFGIRKLFLCGAERIDEAGWARLHAALDAGDPDDEVSDCWVAKEKVRDVYLTDKDLAAELLDDAIAWCTAAESGPELRRLAKMPRHRRSNTNRLAAARSRRRKRREHHPG